jgi:hypothetical protein
MPLSVRQRSCFEVSYLLGLGQRLSELREFATWRQIGETVGRAEQYACAGQVGGVGTPALPADCAAITKYIEKYQGNPDRIVDTRELGTLAIKVRDGSPERFAAGAGFWFGYAFGSCRLSLRDHLDRRSELIDELTAARDNLKMVDPAVTSRAEAILAEATHKPPPYAMITNLIGGLEASIAP